VFGHAGTWHLWSVQGIFADYEIGDLTVPGGLSVRPTPTPMVMDNDSAAHWGAIRPPLPAALMPTGTAASPTPVAAAGTRPQGGRSVPGPLLAGLALAAAGLTLLIGRRLRSRTPTRHAPRPRSTGP